jgi:hypothetical protein
MAHRFTIFAKGNLDVQYSLHSFRVGGEIAWNGVNEIVREQAPVVSVRVRHETFGRSDALLEATGAVPPGLAAQAPPLGNFPATSQFSRALFDARHDAVVLSAQADVYGQLFRHRSDGYLLCAPDAHAWPEQHRHWLRREFAMTGPLDVAASMRNFTAIVSDPAERIHCHLGLEDTVSVRAQRFNLGLIELSQRTGVSIVDVDGVVARGGAERLKLDALHLTAEGHRLVAAEVVRVLADLGCLPNAVAA